MAHLVRKELIELRADPRLFGIVMMAPIIQLTVLGYAASTDVKDVPLLVVDGDRSDGQPPPDQPLRRLGQLRDCRTWSATPTRSSGYLERGEAWMALTIPPRSAPTSPPAGRGRCR